MIIVSREQLLGATEHLTRDLMAELRQLEVPRTLWSNFAITDERGRYLARCSGDRVSLSTPGNPGGFVSGLDLAMRHITAQRVIAPALAVTIGTRHSDLDLAHYFAPELRTLHLHAGPPLDVPPFGLPYQLARVEGRDDRAIADFLNKGL
jgi:hypothetical protein